MLGEIALQLKGSEHKHYFAVFSFQLMARSARVRAPTPVGPSTKYFHGFSRQKVGAMSRWAHEAPAGTNSCKKIPAVMAPAAGPPALLRSAKAHLSNSLYSAGRGNFQ